MDDEFIRFCYLFIPAVTTGQEDLGDELTRKVMKLVKPKRDLSL